MGDIELINKINNITINNYDEENLSRILKEHADFSNSKKLAQKIIFYRKKNKITSTADIEKIFKGVYYVPKKKSIFCKNFSSNKNCC